jgi:hypothetical protein
VIALLTRVEIGGGEWVSAGILEVRAGWPLTAASAKMEAPL